MSAFESGAENQMAALSRRVAQLEETLAQRDSLARQILPATKFLSIFLVIAAFGLLAAQLFLPHQSLATSALIQSALYTSLIGSISFSIMSINMRRELPPQEQKEACAPLAAKAS